MLISGSQALAIAEENRDRRFIRPPQIYTRNDKHTGTTLLDFGPFPGRPDTQFTYSNIPNIGASAIVEAWIFPIATLDHTADEHWVDPPRVYANNVVAGQGFTIYGEARSDSLIDDRPYGVWTVAWVWN
jgi:hypothetical protein